VWLTHLTHLTLSLSLSLSLAVSRDSASNSFSLDSCNHRFCIDCWEGHLSTQINNGNSASLKCPHLNCQSLVTDYAVQKLVATDTYRKYRTFIMQSFVDDNEHVKWCPAPNCGNAITSAMVDGLTVSCKCGYRFCFRCNEQAHLPASCEQMKLWFVKCRDESETKHWIAANTKECPKCLLPTEKNGGCMYINTYSLVVTISLTLTLTLTLTLSLTLTLTHSNSNSHSNSHSNSNSNSNSLSL
jgi:ariadne-1